MNLPFCQCGCGEVVGYRKNGEPRQWVSGHATRKSPLEYIVDEETGCWLWQRARLKNGYGYVRRNYRSQVAHRYIYERERGAVADGFDLHHTCGNRECVNPDHLVPLARSEHAQREEDSRSLLTWEQVREIKARPDEKATVLGAEFGVRSAVITKIRRGETWREPGVAT